MGDVHDLKLQARRLMKEDGGPEREPTVAELKAVIANLMAVQEHMQEGQQHLVAALVQMDARVKRLEEKLGKTKTPPAVLVNGLGERIR